MKTLILTIAATLILLSSGAYALPVCEDQAQVWDNCFGTMTFTSGSQYVGEFKDGKFNGEGTYTSASGTVKSGIWADNEYLYDLAEHRRREENDARTECAKEAGMANTEYAAKKVEKACLEQKGYGKAWYEW